MLYSFYCYQIWDKTNNYKKWNLAVIHKLWELASCVIPKVVCGENRTILYASYSWEVWKTYSKWCAESHIRFVSRALLSFDGSLESQHNREYNLLSKNMLWCTWMALFYLEIGAHELAVFFVELFCPCQLGVLTPLSWGFSHGQGWRPLYLFCYSTN